MYVIHSPLFIFDDSAAYSSLVLYLYLAILHGATHTEVKRQNFSPEWSVVTEC